MRRRRPDGAGPPGHALAGVLLGAMMCLPMSARAASSTAELAGERGCMSCHGLVRKQVGPGFAQVAQRYRGDAGAAAQLAAKIRNGSVGTWGRVIMPAQNHVTAPEAAALAAWVLAQPAQP